MLHISNDELRQEQTCNYFELDWFYFFLFKNVLIEFTYSVSYAVACFRNISWVFHFRFPATSWSFRFVVYGQFRQIIFVNKQLNVETIYYCCCCSLRFVYSDDLTDFFVCVAFLLLFSNREMLSHGDVVFNDNGTVSSIPRHPLVWDEERSMGHKEDDLFILPNIALLVSILSIKYFIFHVFCLSFFHLNPLMVIYKNAVHKISIEYYENNDPQFTIMSMIHYTIFRNEFNSFQK